MAIRRLAAVIALFVSLCGCSTPTHPGPVVSFTFDDGFATDWTVIKPILDAAGIKAGFPIHTGSPDGTGNLTWKQVKQLQDDGQEIIAHTSTHAHLPTLTWPQKVAEINNRSTYEDHGVHVHGFAYPYGELDEETRGIVRDYFDYGLALAHDSSGSEHPLNKYAIRRIALRDTTVTADHYAQIDTAIKNSEILVFVIHSGTQLTTPEGQQRLADVIAYAKAHNVPIVTPGEAVNMVQG